MEGIEEEQSGEEVVLGSTLTMEKVAAAKQFIENHYRSQMKNIQERKERRWVLERKLAASDVPQEEQINLIKVLLTAFRWSLGAIMYEMLIGYPPFYSDDPITTCRKIVHWRTHLRFPEDLRLSHEAKDLICKLLCDVDHRLGTGGAHQIKAHPWFKDVVWDKLYEMDAAFKPEVNGELDTQNFMKFDELDAPSPARSSSGPSRKMLLTPKDLNFVGYTYKNFDAVKGLRHSLDSRNPSMEQQSHDSIYGDSGVGYSTRRSAEETEMQMLTSTGDPMLP
ncbi:serine/threonine-protein kinase CBK1-like isoform X1 [Hibiscus syriacus]|uniref:serine/threonine-protein kinase CBK1-like isoform X1 n=1 Tax=Hibiscus syriacus TaxID=106335 RepID=UPI0019221DA8|nr:serine/threonine-protein kinase CBK1-like isoform X1 [Hibiscus syriacus]